MTDWLETLFEGGLAESIYSKRFDPQPLERGRGERGDRPGEEALCIFPAERWRAWWSYPVVVRQLELDNVRGHPLD